MSKAVISPAILATMLVCIGLPSRSFAADTPPETSQDNVQEDSEIGSETQVHAALDKSVSLSAVDLPLAAVMKDLAEKADVTMQLDIAALESNGISADDATVSVALKGISLRSVLRIVLDQFDLTYMVHEGVLMITTPEEAEGNLITSIYDVVDLISVGDNIRPDRFDYDSLIELITSTVSPDCWDEVGGPGSISGFRGTLVVSQTDEVQGRIKQLLAAARKAKTVAAEYKDNAPPKASIPLTGSDADAEEIARIEKTLNAKADFDFTESPLKDVAATVGKLHEIPILLDRAALEDAGIENNTPVTISVRNLKLRQALALLLRDLELTWIVSDGVLTITTREAAERRLITRAYPVLDLVEVASKQPDLSPLSAAADSDYDSLMELTTVTIAPDAWDEVGGPGAIGVMGAYGFFVINQTYEIHQQLENFYTELRHKIPANAKRVAQREDDGRVRLAVYLLPGSPPNQKANAKAFNQKPDPNVLRQFGGGMDGGGFGAASGAQGLRELEEAPSGEEMLDLITTLIEPESWHAREDVYARAVTSRLVIRHTESVHRQIRELAARLGIHNFSEVPSPEWEGRGAAGPRSGGFF